MLTGSVCAPAARAGLEPATAGASQPHALAAELPRCVFEKSNIYIEIRVFFHIIGIHKYFCTVVVKIQNKGFKFG